MQFFFSFLASSDSSETAKPSNPFDVSFGSIFAENVKNQGLHKTLHEEVKVFDPYPLPSEISQNYGLQNVSLQSDSQKLVNLDRDKKPKREKCRWIQSAVVQSANTDILLNSGVTLDKPEASTSGNVKITAIPKQHPAIARPDIKKDPLRKVAGMAFRQPKMKKGDFAKVPNALVGNFDPEKVSNIEGKIIIHMN